MSLLQRRSLETGRKHQLGCQEGAQAIAVGNIQLCEYLRETKPDGGERSGAESLSQRPTLPGAWTSEDLAECESIENEQRTGGFDKGNLDGS